MVVIFGMEKGLKNGRTKMLVESITESKLTPMTHLAPGQILAWYAIKFVGVQESDLEPKNSMVLKVCAGCPANLFCYRIGFPDEGRLNIEVPGAFMCKGNERVSGLNCITGKIVPNRKGSYDVYEGEEQDYKYRDILFKAFNVTMTTSEREGLEFQTIFDVCSGLLNTDTVNRSLLSAHEFENWIKIKYPADIIKPTIEVMKKVGGSIVATDFQDFLTKVNGELELKLTEKEISACSRILREALNAIAKPEIYSSGISTPEVETTK